MLLYFDHPANYISGIAYGIEGVLSVISNALMILFLVSDPKNLNPPDQIILGLCIVDCIFGASSVAEFHYILFDNQGIGCKVVGSVQYALAASSLVCPCLAMLNR